MSTTLHARRSALRLMLAGTAVSVLVGCETLTNAGLASSRQTTDGSELANRVHSALRANAFTSTLVVQVSSTSEDTVVIEGFVANDIDVTNLDLVANQVEGVRHATVDVFVRE